MTPLSKERRFKRHTPDEQGVTLIETLVVIAIIAIAVGMAVPNLLSYRPKYAFNRAVHDLYGNLQWARLVAIRENTSCQVIFDETNHSFSVIKNPGPNQTELRSVDLTDDEGYHPDIRVSPNSANKITYNSRGTGSAGTVVVSIPYRYCENDDDCCICITAASSGRVKKKTKTYPRYNSECKNRCP